MRHLQYLEAPSVARAVARAKTLVSLGLISVDVSFSLAWGGTFKTREDLAQAVGTRLLTALQDSFRQTQDGWRLAFDPREMLASHSLTEGNYWVDWLATDCPALLIRGQDSRVTTHLHLEQMAARRPNTFFNVLDGGHVVHVDNPTGFTETISKFLLKL